MSENNPFLLYSALILSVLTLSCQRIPAGNESTAALTSNDEPTLEEAQKKPVTMSHKDCSKTEDGVADLPYSHGKIFATLDEYLAHLKKLSAIDLPYWRQIRPGVYEQVTSMTGTERQTATREELMKRYCFDSE